MHKKELKKIHKTCKFPGCCAVFEAYPQTKYCVEHRQTKYRKHLPNKHKVVYPNDNLKLISDFTEVKVVRKKCAHLDCNKSYDITIYPGQVTYCNFCEDHRNPYKRSRKQ